MRMGHVLRVFSAVFLLVVFATTIYFLGMTSNRVSNVLFPATPTPAVCAHQHVVVNGDDLSYFSINQTACNP